MPEEKKVFRTVNSLFYNSQCLFVEFHDVIAMPWLTMLKINLDSEAINKIFKVDGFSDYSTNALLEWYIYRKKRNIYEEIGVRETINPPEDFYDEFLKLCMTGCDYSIDVYKVNTNLKFAEICDELNHKKSFVKKIVFYSEYEEPGIAQSHPAVVRERKAQQKEHDGKERRESNGVRQLVLLTEIIRQRFSRRGHVFDKGLQI